MSNFIPKGWRYDPLNKPDYGFAYGDRINFVDNHYCELSRNVRSKRIFRLVVFIFFFSLLLFMIFDWFQAVIDRYYNWIPAVFIISFTIIFLYIFSFNLFSNLMRGFFSPQDCPIRFNRVTQKVYIYEDGLAEYAMRFLLPFKAFKQLRQEKIKVYHWDDVQGVQLTSTMLLSRGTTSSNYFTMGLVNDPQTVQTKDSFMIAYQAGMNAEEWNWVCHYMLGNDIILNLDKQNSTHENTFMALNKKSNDNPLIIGLDKASKASSKEELAQIEQAYQLNQSVYLVG